MKTILVLCAMLCAMPSQACTVKNQAALLTQFSSCASQGLPDGCITPEDIQDLICSIPTLAAVPARAIPPTKASTGFASLTTNPGSYTYTETDLGLVIAGPDQGADAINAVCKTPPASPYSIVTHLSMTTNLTSNDSGGGFMWRDPAAGKIITNYFLILPTSGTVQPSMFSINFASATGPAAGSAGFVVLHALQTQPSAWQKISDNGSQIQAFYSFDGQGWKPIFSPIAYASSYLGIRPPQVCLFASGHNDAVSVTFDYYKETSP